jgi:hypothetical protein
MNNSGTNSMNAAGPMGYLLGTGIPAQILLAIVLATVLYIILMSLEMLYKSFVAVTGTRVDLLPFTVSADDKPREYEQNPNVRGHKLLPLSDNERSGAEFSYAFYLWINPSSFRQEDGLLHIMHKGNPVPFPLMAPGVFLRSNINALRVYMNSSKKWNNYIDVENIPVKKWVHITVIARANAVEIYLNGNLAKKLNMEDATLYQNFGNLYLFSSRPCMVNMMSPESVGDANSNKLQVFGTYNGNMSNLFYYSYALSYTEIQGLVNEGPSSKTENTTSATPPYLQDTWWVNNYSS